MAETPRRTPTTVLIIALLVALVGGLGLLAASGTVAADQHEPENAPTYNTSDGGANFTIAFPDTTDHYPGDHPVHSEQDGYNASIEYYATAQAAFTEQGADDGIWMDFILLEADWIDYSECDATQNTKVFGIDRGNNNSGTNTDEDLIEHREGSELDAGGLTVTFSDWGGFSSPPYVGAGDAVVAAQGAGSRAGPCLKMTDEPGWYRIQAYANGSIATKCKEEGNSQCEPDDKEFIGVNLNSNYIYVCECDSEQAAREELGPPPSEEGSSSDGGGGGGGGSESTPTATSDGGGGESEATPTPTETATATPTPTPVPNTPTQTQAEQPNSQQNQQQNNQQNQQQNNQQSQQQSNQQSQQQSNQQSQQNQQPGPNDRSTPTISDGPGFTPVAALVALLAAAMLVLRRR